MEALKSEKKFMIMRYPVLMEDEGRTFFIDGPMSEEEANDWISKQKGQYFGPGDYFISEANTTGS